MIIRLYNEEELARLCSMDKRVTNPGAHWTNKPRVRPAHRQRNFKVIGHQDDSRFSVYLRKNLTDECDFSCGIVYLPHGASPLTLARYNGPGHRHGDIHYRTHIHRVSESAMEAGRKPESAAVETNRFETLEGALACLIEDFNLAGISAQHDQPRLF